MGSPEKPFACAAPDCTMRFTNEDHLNVHSKKHDLELQLGVGHKSAIFPADQTPTPTRFIRNCEEVGLFQDLQNVNPFDEGFKEAMEKGRMLVSADGIVGASTSDDALHTPHIFPSPPDVSGTKDTTKIMADPTTVAHFESTLQTKLTNEITVQENVTTIQSNIEMTKSGYSTVIASSDPNLIKLVVNNSEKNVLLTDTTKLPIFSQKSIEEALESLKSEAMNKERNESLINTFKKNMKSTLKNIDENNIEFSKKGKKRRAEVATANKYEVMLKLPNGELVHMQSLQKEKQLSDPKQKLKDAIENKLKNEIEEKIKMDIENRINSQIQTGNFILRVKGPDVINSATTKNTLVNIAPKPSGNLVPVIVTAPNLLVPVQDVHIPQVSQVKVQDSMLTGPKIKSLRRRSIKTVNRVTHHKIDCAILQIVGGVCNMNCADTSKLDYTKCDPHKVDKVSENLDALQPNNKKTTVSDVTQSNECVDNTKMTLIEPKINQEPTKKSSHTFSHRLGNQAAVKRYREKQKRLFQRTLKINEIMQNENRNLRAEVAALKNIIMDHCQCCPIANTLRTQLREKETLPANK